MTGSMLMEIEEVLMKEQPDWVLVYGDTNSTLAGAMAAVKLSIPIAHVEAGCRLGTLKNPEEVNRVVTDRISQLRFTPTEIELKHLEKENLSEDSYIVGNIMYDSYLYASKQELGQLSLLDFDNHVVELPEEYYYLTCHRQENTYSDEPLYEILSAMNQLECPTVYPVHPRNRERAARLMQQHQFHNIILIQPVGYMESIYLLNHSKKVVTDSGGLQCEAFYAGKQCVTVFDLIIWPQTMVGNRNQLARPEQKDILEKLSAKQMIDEAYQPFGDGHSAEKVLEYMEQYMP